jgi:hypothetical protein
MSDVITAMVEYRDKVGHFPPSHEIAECLRPNERVDFQEDKRSAEQWARDDATNQMVAGELQLTASRLLGQIPQESMGRREMMSGMHALRRLNEETRERLLSPKKKRERIIPL